MKLQYATAVMAIFLVSLHLLMQGVLFPYKEAVSFQRVLTSYRNYLDGTLVELLLVVVLAHGFNGLRVVLLEWRQSAAWTKGVNWVTLLSAMATIGYGTRTVLVAATGAPG